METITGIRSMRWRTCALRISGGWYTLPSELLHTGGSFREKRVVFCSLLGLKDISVSHGLRPADHVAHQHHMEDPLNWSMHLIGWIRVAKQFEAPESSGSSVATESSGFPVAPESSGFSMAPESSGSSMAPESSGSSVAPESQVPQWHQIPQVPQWHQNPR